MNEIYHIPAMLRETIHGLNIQPNGLYVDVTFGGGGHSRAILEALNSGLGTCEKGEGKLFSNRPDRCQLPDPAAEGIQRQAPYYTVKVYYRTRVITIV